MPAEKRGDGGEGPASMSLSKLGLEEQSQETRGATEARPTPA